METQEIKANEHLPEKMEAPEEPSLLESYGSFPVWMLKAIDLVTPDFLVSTVPPKKKKIRI